ncbi:hypothetical protein EDB89DRAFT_2017824 [Lactarius sanguifluus]|nr:hypothetical protein EDB89DRAFT_2017824 [Lactarius sanguifluus]
MSRNDLDGQWTSRDSRLQKISLCGVSFPALSNLLLSFRDLVELQLLEILILAIFKGSCEYLEDLECCISFFRKLSQFICSAETLPLRLPDKVLLFCWQGRSTGSPIVGSFSLNFPYFHLNWQLSCVSQIHWLDDAGAAEWTSIFASFVTVEELCLSDPLGQHVAQALALPRTTGQAEILPALRSVVFEGPQDTGNPRATAGPCRRSDRPVAMHPGSDNPP